MKVKLLVSRSGADGASDRGDVIEVSDAEGKRMIDAKPPQAVPYAPPKVAEKATKKRKG